MRLPLVVVGAALALALPAGAVTPSGKLPTRGVLAPGQSLGGIRLGDTAATVRARWGTRYTRCRVCGPTTWLFTYPRGYPAGAAVSFRRGRVTAIFTLGAPRGWRTTQGLYLGEPSKRILAVYGRLAHRRCIGYGALSMRSPRAVTSIYTYGESIYGFALTRPTEPVCQ